MVNNPPHLFTLNPIAADYVKFTKKGRKSKMVSRAIIWFNQDVNELRLQIETLEQTIIVLRDKLSMMETKLEQKSSFWSKLFKK